mgnify:CR=1 FL=1
MRYSVHISGKQLVLTEPQLAMLMTAVQDADQISERHVGTDKGSQGYQNSYVPTIEVKQPHDWLTVQVMADDFVEATKLTMKLSPGEP